MCVENTFASLKSILMLIQSDLDLTSTVMCITRDMYQAIAVPAMYVGLYQLCNRPGKSFRGLQSNCVKKNVRS